MADKDNDYNWSSFMQERKTQLLLYGICVISCLFYAVDGILELLSAERSARMIAMMGAGGYYAMTIIRTIVLIVTAIAFGRIAYKTYKKQ